MRFEVNGTSLHVFEAGAENIFKEKPTLVFLHYFGGSSRAWLEVIGGLAMDYRCLAPDLRGFGASAGGDGYTIDDYADDIEALIERLALKSYVLVGHSMGGKLALAMAARAPVNLHSLILLAPSPPSPEPIRDDERKRMLETHGTRRAAAETVEKASGGNLSTEFFEQAIEDNLRTNETAWRAWLETGSREDISPAMKKIKAPVLVITGAEDQGMTPALMRQTIIVAVADACLVVIPEAHHLLPLEAPRAVIELIREYCR